MKVGKEGGRKEGGRKEGKKEERKQIQSGGLRNPAPLSHYKSIFDEFNSGFAQEEYSALMKASISFELGEVEDEVRLATPAPRHGIDRMQMNANYDNSVVNESVYDGAESDTSTGQINSTFPLI